MKLFLLHGPGGSEQPGQLKLPFQDLSEQQIWDAAWDDEDVDSAPATLSEPDPFLHLPEETELERLENAHKVTFSVLDNLILHPHRMEFNAGLDNLIPLL